MKTYYMSKVTTNKGGKKCIEAFPNLITETSLGSDILVSVDGEVATILKPDSDEGVKYLFVYTNVRLRTVRSGESVYDSDRGVRIITPGEYEDGEVGEIRLPKLCESGTTYYTATNDIFPEFTRSSGVDTVMTPKEFIGKLAERVPLAYIRSCDSKDELRNIFNYITERLGY